MLGRDGDERIVQAVIAAVLGRDERVRLANHRAQRPDKTHVNVSIDAAVEPEREVAPEVARKHLKLHGVPSAHVVNAAILEEHILTVGVIVEAVFPFRIERFELGDGLRHHWRKHFGFPRLVNYPRDCWR